MDFRYVAGEYAYVTVQPIIYDLIFFNGVVCEPQLGFFAQDVHYIFEEMRLSSTKAH